MHFRRQQAVRQGQAEQHKTEFTGLSQTGTDAHHDGPGLGKQSGQQGDHQQFAKD